MEGTNQIFQLDDRRPEVAAAFHLAASLPVRPARNAAPCFSYLAAPTPGIVPIAVSVSTLPVTIAAKSKTGRVAGLLSSWWQSPDFGAFHPPLSAGTGIISSAPTPPLTAPAGIRRSKVASRASCDAAKANK